MWLANRYNAALVIATIGLPEYRRLVRGPQGARDREIYSLKLPKLRYPFHLRHGTSDGLEVMHTLIREA